MPCIGINIGDVIYDEARIYGDGINVAARLEGIAEPGGICISSKVYEEISSRVDLAIELHRHAMLERERHFFDFVGCLLRRDGHAEIDDRDAVDGWVFELAAS